MAAYDHPIRTLHLFRDANSRLIELLRGLSEDDWRKPTLCSQWDVKDVAAHLYDGSIRRLSMQRDRWVSGDGPADPADYRSLVDFINRLNGDWVRVARRISPELLIRQMAEVDAELVSFLETLDPDAPAFWPVAWAGDRQSPNWFDIAREYTEKWLHQQHIRHAVGRPGLMDRDHYHPVLDAFMIALPYTFREVEAAPGTAVAVRVEGNAGGTWTVVKSSDAWTLRMNAAGPSAAIDIPEEFAWRIFTKGMAKADARGVVRLEGDARLASAALDLVSVMA